MILICSTLVSCLVFSCVARLFQLMDFRTRYIHLKEEMDLRTSVFTCSALVLADGF